MNDRIEVQIYPVGLLADLKQRRLWRGLGYVRRQAANGNWRAVRNYFNGYLAEIENIPADWGGIDCGRGWTKNRALRSLTHNVAESMLGEQPLQG